MFDERSFSSGSFDSRSWAGLLVDTVPPVVEPGFSGGMPFMPYRRRPREEDEAILLAVLH